MRMSISRPRIIAAARTTSLRASFGWFGCFSGDFRRFGLGEGVDATTTTARKIRFKKWPFENWTKWLMLLPCTDPRPRHTSRTAEEPWLEAGHSHTHSHTSVRIHIQISWKTHTFTHTLMSELGGCPFSAILIPTPLKKRSHNRSRPTHTHAHSEHSYDVRDPHPPPPTAHPLPPLVLMGRRNWVRPLKESS